jgi:Ras-related protein Rab-1A
MSAELMNRMLEKQEEIERKRSANHSREYDYLLKFKILGDSGVGKSSLLLRWADDTFTESFISTIGVDFKTKTMDISGATCKIQTWDTAGQERFRTNVDQNHRGAHGIILVCDLTNRASFENLHKWVQECERYASENVPIIIVGTKSDLVNDQQVSVEELTEYTRQLSLPDPVITSSKNNIDVSEVFENLAEQFLNNLVDDYEPVTKSKKIPPKQRYTSAQLTYINELDAIWDKNMVVNRTPEQKIIEVLMDYTKNDSGFIRFFTGHWNRHHVDDANHIIKYSKGKTAAQLLSEIENIKQVEPDKFNKFGTVATMIDFIKFRLKNPQYTTQQNNINRNNYGTTNPQSFKFK